jgi:hypothetical protein
VNSEAVFFQEKSSDVIIDIKDGDEDFIQTNYSEAVIDFENTEDEACDDLPIVSVNQSAVSWMK